MAAAAAAALVVKATAAAVTAALATATAVAKVRLAATTVAPGTGFERRHFVRVPRPGARRRRRLARAQQLAARPATRLSGGQGPLPHRDPHP